MKFESGVIFHIRAGDNRYSVHAFDPDELFLTCGIIKVHALYQLSMNVDLFNQDEQ
jgi:hypothetical protein